MFLSSNFAKAMSDENKVVVQNNNFSDFRL